MLNTLGPCWPFPLPLAKSLHFLLLSALLSLCFLSSGFFSWSLLLTCLSSSHPYLKLPLNALGWPGGPQMPLVSAPTELAPYAEMCPGGPPPGPESGMAWRFSSWIPFLI